jgi:arylsulfatase A-like enzyme
VLRERFDLDAFDRLAHEGILFETYRPTHPPPSRPRFLLTGVSPSPRRPRHVGFRARDDIPTLASILKDAGYRTGGFVGSFVLDARFGLGRGFDLYSDKMPETERGLLERRGEEVLKEATEWIDGDREQPFFAFLHFYDPHRPYDPPDPFEPGIEDSRARYRGEILYVDSLLGKLLDFLEARGLSDSTVVVVTADHGESLGEHGEDTHGFFLYQSTLRVPLLVRAPVFPAGGASRMSRAPWTSLPRPSNSSESKRRRASKGRALSPRRARAARETSMSMPRALFPSSITAGASFEV